jgi:hypothetical protein
MKKAKLPLVPIANSKAEVVLIDPSKNRQVASKVGVSSSIRRGLAQAHKGLGRLADEVFDELEHDDSAQ